MQVKGICRVGQKSLNRVTFKDGGSLVQGFVFALSDRGMPVLLKLIVRGGNAENLVALPQGTLLRVEGEQYQETFDNDQGVKQYITVIDAWRISILTPAVEFVSESDPSFNGVPA